MSTFYDIEEKCSVCGNISKQIELGSTNSFGSPDLELREPGMIRATMHTWIQECPICGYVSSNISNETNISIDFLESDFYKFSGGIKLPELADKFYKSYLINIENKNYLDAFYDILHAAWVCDDYDYIKGAIYCRNIAVNIENTIIKNENLIVDEIDPGEWFDFETIEWLKNNVESVDENSIVFKNVEELTEEQLLEIENYL